MLDARGTQIIEGARVAYNLSGDVAVGVVVRMPGKQGQHPRWGHYVGGPITIELTHNAAGMSKGHLSKVKNPRSVLVLKDGEA